MDILPDRCLMVRTHGLNGPPVGTEAYPGKPQYAEQNDNESEQENIQFWSSCSRILRRSSRHRRP
jgi:hypothetical protein